MMHEVEKKQMEPKINYKINYYLLSTGQFISQLGTSMFSFALSLYVLDVTGSSSSFSMVLMFSMLPGLIVNIVAGVFVDNHNKKRIMVIADVLSGIWVIVFRSIFILYPTNIVVLVLYTSVLSMIQAFYNLSVNASIPDVVSKDKVVLTNSTFQSIKAVINILGGVVGAVAYEKIGIEVLFILNGVSFILSGIGEMFIKFNPDAEIKKKITSGYKENIREVLKYLNSNKILKFLLGFAVIVNFFYNPLIIIALPYISYNEIMVTGLQMSFIKAASAVGLILGAIFISSKASHTIYLKKFFILLKIQAVLILLWNFCTFPALNDMSKDVITVLFCVLLIGYGFLQNIQNIPMISYFQLKVPEELRGRVFSVLFTALQATTPLGIFIYGIILDKVRWTYVIAVSAFFIFIISVYGSKSMIFKEFILNLDKKNSSAV